MKEVEDGGLLPLPPPPEDEDKSQGSRFLYLSHNKLYRV